MAIVNRMASDLTGEEGNPDEFGSFIVRSGPGVEKAVVWDVKPTEIGELKAAEDVFVVEYRPPGTNSIGTQVEEMVITKAELVEKVVPKGKKLEQLLDEARFLRGRRPGSSVNGR